MRVMQANFIVSSSSTPSATLPMLAPASVSATQPQLSHVPVAVHLTHFGAFSPSAPCVSPLPPCALAESKPSSSSLSPSLDSPPLSSSCYSQRIRVVSNIPGPRPTPPHRSPRFTSQQLVSLQKFESLFYTLNPQCLTPRGRTNAPPPCAARSQHLCHTAWHRALRLFPGPLAPLPARCFPALCLTP
jgi:hypothetical protein